MKAKKLLEAILLGLGASAFALVLWVGGALDRWEFATWTWRVELLAGPGPATDRIKLILLDQSSLDWGKTENGWGWPWPREVYGPIIDFCIRSGARAVVFDVVYSEPSIYGQSDDQSFGQAIRRMPVFANSVFAGESAGSTASWPQQVPDIGLSIEGLDEWLSSARAGSITIPYATFPVPEVASAASILGNVSDEPDVDGVFRRIGAFRVFDGRPILSLGLASYFAAEVLPGLPSHPLRLEAGRLHMGERKIPMDDSGRAILRFRGSSGAYDTFSAAAIIQSELRLRAGERPPIEDIGIFKDCYVFFGFSAPGLMDLRPTPVSRVSPGVEIYATALDNLLSDDFIRESPKPLVVLSTILLAVCSAVAAVSWSRKAWHSTLTFAVFLPLPAAAGFAAYVSGWWWPVIVQESAAVVSLVGAVVLNYATEGRQKAFIKHAFRHYLSPAVIDQILENPSQLKLGGERRELTILFSDLQGFSSISERLDPQALTSLLNDYLSDMTDIILEEGGTLDKYEGDAIIAFWNAPVAQQDHAARACRAAVRCQRKLQERREEFRQRTGELLYCRIGINTGTVVVGNMGSHKRFDYTVLGDAANLASRLEGANKAFGTYTMVSEATWSQASSHITGREIGLLRVVGRKTPVRTYELTGFAGEMDGAADRENFEMGLKLCHEGRWPEALSQFAFLPDDPLARVYADRCRRLSQDTSACWDVVWNLTEK